MRISGWSSDVCSSDLLENLLLHEVAVIAFLDRRGGDARGRNFALGRVVVSVENLRAFPRDDDPVALVEIGDLLRQRRERERIRAQVGDRKSTRLNSSH